MRSIHVSQRLLVLFLDRGAERHISPKGGQAFQILNFKYQIFLPVDAKHLVSQRLPRLNSPLQSYIYLT